MAITAELDCIGKSGATDYVAYVKIFKDGLLVDTPCIKYNPVDDKSFREEIGKRILNAENSVEAIKAQAAAALDEVVKTQITEIEARKLNQTEVSK